MTLSLSALLRDKTAAEFLDQILAVLRANGFPVDAWQSGGNGRTLAKCEAAALLEFWRTVQAIARGAYLDDATGDWLTVHALSRYAVERAPSVFTRGSVLLSCSAGAGPYTIAAGALLVSDGIRRFRSVNLAPVVVPSAGSVSVEVMAESAGSLYNVAPGAITRLLAPSLAGLSVSNPVVSGGTWISRAGSEGESDVELRQRCRDKWATLGAGATLEAYRYIVRSTPGFESELTRVSLYPGAGNGRLTLWLAGPSGPSGGVAVAAAAARVATRKPVTDTPTVIPAVALPVPIVGTVFVRAEDDSPENRARAIAGLTALQAALEIGSGVDLLALGASIYLARGLLDVDLSSPAADVPGAVGSVPVFDVSGLAWSVV